MWRCSAAPSLAGQPLEQGTLPFAPCCEPWQYRLHLERAVSTREEASEKAINFRMNFISVIKRNCWVSPPSPTIMHPYAASAMGSLQPVTQ